MYTRKVLNLISRDTDSNRIPQKEDIMSTWIKVLKTDKDQQAQIKKIIIINEMKMN